MARVPPTKSKDLATPQPNNGKLYTAALLKVNSKGTVLQEPKGSFLLNPSSYRETKTANWVGHNVPMQSDPVYQYVSGGPRVVSFEALVTRDSIHFGKDKDGPLEGLVDGALNAIGDIASEFAGVSFPPIADLFPIPSSGDGTQLSVGDRLMYYRSLMYPEYKDQYKAIDRSPPLVVLVVGRTFSDVGIPAKISGAGSPTGPHLPVWMVKSIDINITKMLPNSDPMEARVTFTLEEYAIRPISGGNFTTVEPAGPADDGVIGSIAGAISDAIGGLF